MRVDNYGFVVTDGAFDAGHVNEHFQWIAALDAYDFNDPEPLSEILKSDTPIPEEMRPILARIIRGERAPNKNAAAKSRIPAADRMHAAAAVSILHGLIDLFQHEKTRDTPDTEWVTFVENQSDRKQKEPIDVLKDLTAWRERVVNERAERYGVSPHTIRSLVRLLRKKISSYPDI
ncbi:MAG: hypothetical protein ACFE0P_00410 [Oceanicaulis sp.]